VFSVKQCPIHSTKERPMKILYETEATAIGGRSGSAASADGALKIRLAMPEALGGHGGEGSNPEQLFAAGYAACFLSAVKDAAAHEQAVVADDANVTATVALGTRGDGPGLRWQVALGIDLPGLDRATAERIVASARQACPYSNATRGNVDVRLWIA
jgi:Ohr subfamily peroxiredoxin